MPIKALRRPSIPTKIQGAVQCKVNEAKYADMNAIHATDPMIFMTHILSSPYHLNVSIIIHHGKR
jgi:hypothetical protein